MKKIRIFDIKSSVQIYGVGKSEMFVFGIVFVGLASTLSIFLTTGIAMFVAGSVAVGVLLGILVTKALLPPHYLNYKYLIKKVGYYLPK
jgi:hypothetical protein